MRSTRKRFVLWFLAFGYAFTFATRFVLSQPPEALWASPEQQPWQKLASTILAPLKIALVGPVVWLQRDPDPPPPFRIILCAVYWSILALGIYQLLPRKVA